MSVTALHPFQIVTDNVNDVRSVFSLKRNEKGNVD
jgi:hypothetical protein